MVRSVVDATDNAKVSAWLKKEYEEYSYYISSGVSKSGLSDKELEKLEEKTLKFAQDFMKKFICKGNEWTSEKSRLKRVEKFGKLRQKVSDKWEKQSAKKQATEQKQSVQDKHRKSTKQISEQQSIMERYVKNSLIDKVTRLFK